MDIAVLIKLVPDLVEELEVDSTGKSLDTTFMRRIINEPDEHALEQALLIKEGSGGSVSVIGLDVADMDDVLFTAAAKGADRQIKLTGEFEHEPNNHDLARLFVSVLKGNPPDLILTGVQAHNDLDGAVGPLVAEYLGLPYVGYIAGVSVENGGITVFKEYTGGLVGELHVSLPAVLGIQSAEKPPRYVAVSKVRQAMKTASLDERAALELDLSEAAAIERMFVPESGERAKMLEGDVEQVADQIVGLLKNTGVL